MKRTILILILGFLAFAPLSAQEYRGVVSFQGNRLREEAGNLIVDLGVHIGSGAVAECQSMRLTPELTTGEQALEMPYIEIQGKRRGRLNDRWEALRSKKQTYREPYCTVRVSPDSKHGAGTDTLVGYRMAIPYEAWMDDARLVVHQEIIGCHNEFQLLTFAMDSRVALESREPYVPTFETVLIEPAAEVKRRSRQGQAFLDFPVNQSVINPGYRRNPEELAKIDEAIFDIQNNSDAQIQGLYIHGSASPEGGYANNDRLARDRSFALRNCMMDRLGLSGRMFVVDYTAEDWDGLKALVLDSNIAYRDEIVDIIENTSDPERREARLIRLGGGVPWRTMLRDMFPALRCVQYQIDYSVRDFTMDEVVTIIGRRDDLLSHRELFMGALTYGKDTPQYDEIFIDRIIRNFPDDPAALNNAAAVLIERGESVTARRYLDRAGENPATWNNRGILYMQAGDLDSAEALFDRAAAGGVEQAVSNLEQLRLKREDNIKMERYNR